MAAVKGARADGVKDAARPAPRIEDFYGQSPHIAKLHETFVSGRQVHAYLFTGPRGTGKRTVALLLAMTALCRGEGAKPCGICGPCRRALAGTHPDIHVVAPQKDRKTVGVDAMRDVIAEVSVRAFEDGAKAILIPQAEQMTAAAQNALLKTLEEPPAGTTFFLCTDQPAALLPTVVSRCRTVRFHPLEVADAAKRLVQLGETPERAMEKARMAEGCVGQALLIDDALLALRRELTGAVFSVKSPADVPAVLAAYRDDKERQAAVMDALESAVRDILLAQAGGAPLAGAGLAPQAEAYARAVPLSGALALAGSVSTARRMLGSNVAFASVLESILLKVSEEYRQWPW